MKDDPGLICYAPKKFNAEHMKIIASANAIIQHYASKGYSLTLRSLYYKAVGRNVIENTAKSYDRFGDIISAARMAGLISWTAIEDNLRSLEGVPHVTNPAQAVQGARDKYAIDLWADQEWRPEVWVEKDAMVGVIEGICSKLRVNFFACRGYASMSSMWRAGQRLAGYVQKGQRPIIFHFGDHDPSGIDMTRDNRERLAMFTGVKVPVVRLALNMDQVEHYKLPPNPAKVSDKRIAAYAARFFPDEEDMENVPSWELDAVEPERISQLIEENVARIRDDGLWEKALAQEAADKDALDALLEEMD